MVAATPRTSACLACDGPVPAPARGKAGRACSGKCRRLLRASKAKMRPCPVCGIFFRSEGRQQCCSRSCGNRLRAAKRGVAVWGCRCKRCGRLYFPKTPARNTYCSRECAYADRAARCIVCAEPSGGARYCSSGCEAAATLRLCVACGKKFVPCGRGRQTKCCSDACRAKNAADRTAAANGGRKKLPRATCLLCGKTKPPGARVGNLYCSPRCTSKASKKRQATTDNAAYRAGKARQMRRRLGAVRKGESFLPEEIFERDGWQCQLCGAAVDCGAHHLSPFAPSLDHIVPLSKGGPHTRANVQCAHRQCNAEQRDLPGKQMRLFG